MKAIAAMVRKDIQLILTSKATVFFTFIFPLLFVLLFGSLLGGDKSDRKIAIALVAPTTMEGGAQQFIEQLRAMSELQITDMTLEQAQTAVRKGKITAYVEVPETFSAQWQKMFSATPPTLNIGADPSRSAESAMLEGLLMKAGAARFKSMFSGGEAMQAQLQTTIDSVVNDPNIDGEWKQLLGDYLPKIKQLSAKQTPAVNGQFKGVDMSPLKVQHIDVSRQRSGPPNAYSVLFPQAIVWAMLGGMMGFGVSLAKERARGSLVRLLVAPIPSHYVLLGKAAACLLTMMGTASAIMVLGVTVFDVPIQQPLILLLALLAVAMVFTAMMLALTVIAKTEEAIGGGGWGVFMVLSMIGGNMIPLFLMPAWMQNVALISPIRWAIVALEGAIWREYSVFEMLMPIIVLLTLATLCFVFAKRLFQRDWIQA